MLEREGNLWDAEADVTVITTNAIVKANGACVMGRGCAKEARDTYPGIDLQLGAAIRTHGNVPILLPQHDRLIVTFPVKAHWREAATLELIQQSSLALVQLADEHEWESIAMPRPGCGNGRLSWEYEVSRVLDLDDRFTVYSFGKGA